MRLCWNGIVKNESARIERMLDSLGPFIDFVVVVDTGSTDDTKQKIKAWCDLHHIECRLYDAIFENWSQARNAALAHARAVWCSEGQPFDYLLLVDADMELVVKDRTCFDALEGGSWDMTQRAGAVVYRNRRLLSADQWTGDNRGRPVAYVGVTHEYLDCAAVGAIPEAQAYFIDHADGANRPEKFKRDIRLLTAALRLEPKNERYMFYLAQSYRDAGEPERAAEWYQRRIDAGGWDEEVWQAHVNMAACFRQSGNEDRYVHETLRAYARRPSRAEPLYDLAKMFREKGHNAPAAAFAAAALPLPVSDDALFVNEFVYKIGLKEEMSIAGYYVPQYKGLGFRSADEIAIGLHPYGVHRELARANLFHYLPTVKEILPSFQAQRVMYDPPREGWAAMNPSVALYEDELLLNVRLVNYKIDDQGRYLIRGTDGTANPTNPITTENVLLTLNNDLSIHTAHPIECGELEVAFPLVLGFEDLRLLPVGNRVFGSATVRQFHPDGNCEQAFVELLYFPVGPAQLRLVRRMLREPRVTEKNWAPVLHPSKKPMFMRYPGEMVNARGETMQEHPIPWERTMLSGGSQVIPFFGGYLAIVHTAHHLPGSHRRYYMHRLIRYDAALRPVGLSFPFVLHEKEIEYVAGLCWHPDGERLVLSYGRRDAEAWIATVRATDVRMQ